MLWVMFPAAIKISIAGPLSVSGPTWVDGEVNVSDGMNGNIDKLSLIDYLSASWTGSGSITSFRSNLLCLGR